MFNWANQQPKTPLTPHEQFLERLRGGVPLELACRAIGYDATKVRTEPEVDKAMAEGEILLFERARDSGVTGIVRAAMRNEANTWQQKAEIATGKTLEDLLRE